MEIERTTSIKPSRYRLTTNSTGTSNGSGGAISVTPAASYSESAGLSREKAEGQGDASKVVDGLESTYKDSDSQGPGNSGKAGKGDKGANTAEAQAQISENNEKTQEASKLGQESAAELGQIASQTQQIRNTPAAGPKSDIAPVASRKVKERAPSMVSPELNPLGLDKSERLKGEELPRAKKGRTETRLEVEEGSPGKDTVKRELEEQTEVRRDNKLAQEKSEQMSPVAERQKGQIEQDKVKSQQQQEKDKNQLEQSQRQLEADRKSKEEASKAEEQAQQRVQQDQAQVQNDQQIVSQDQQHVSTAQESKGAADQEIKGADEMRQKADQRVAEANQFKPGNGGPNQKGKGGQGGQGAAPAQGKGQGQGKGAGGAGGGKGKGGAANGNGNGNGHGVVWKKVRASAQKFQQQARVRQQLSRQRQALAQSNLDTAKTKLEQDQKGLQKSEKHLERSEQNRGVAQEDSRTAMQNLNTTQTTVSSLKKRVSKLRARLNSLQQAGTQNQAIRQHLERGRTPLLENDERSQLNEAKLKKELTNAPERRVVELEELKVQEAASSQAVRPANQSQV